MEKNNASRNQIEGENTHEPKNSVCDLRSGSSVDPGVLFLGTVINNTHTTGPDKSQ